MAIDKERIMTLALERLQTERDRIDAEMAALRAEMSPRRSRKKNAPAKKTRKRPKLSAAERKARSERMKKYWADRRKAKAAKKS